MLARRSTKAAKVRYRIDFAIEAGSSDMTYTRIR